MPTIVYKVEIAFSTSPALPLASQTWTDVTGSVLTTGTGGQPISIRFGRQEEFSRVNPATCSFVLDNTTGIFTPDSTTAPAPYLGNVDLAKLVRVTATVGGTDYRRFTGHVDSWEIADWGQAGAHKVVAVQATDRLKRLQTSRPLRSFVEEEILASAPHAYWPLGEPADAVSAASITTTPRAPLVSKRRINGGSVDFGQGTSLGTDGLSAPTFSPLVDPAAPATLVGNAYLGGALSPALSWGGGAGVNPISLSCFFTPSTIFGLPNLTTIVSIESGAWSLQVLVDELGQMYGSLLDTASSFSFQTAYLLTQIRVGVTYCVLISANPGGALNVYLASSQQAPNTLFSVNMGTMPTASRTGIATVTVGDAFAGTVSHVAVWQALRQQNEFQTIRKAGFQALAGLRTDEALSSLARFTPIPAAEITTETGLSRVGSLATQGRSALDVVGEIENTEDGVVFADGAGQIQFHGRGHRFNPGSPTLTVPVGGDTISGLGFRKDDTNLLNDVTVTRDGGASYRVTDATSAAARGVYASTLAVNVSSDPEAADRASYRVAAYRTPLTRASEIPVNLTTATGPADFLGLKLGDLVALSGLTTDKPAIGSLWIEGWVESISTTAHTVAFNTSPVLLPGTAFFVIGTSSIGGTDILAY